ncbi:MAG: proline--tRNA ligase [Candidatus Makana argininalis]
MLASKYLLFTLKKVNNNTEKFNNKLMIRSGMIRKLSSGIYTWLPTGLRILRKVENIIRKEMNKINSIEISLPIIQPIDLFKKSGRLLKYKNNLFIIKDRSNKLLILGPTHEELITKIMSNNNFSYKQFPIILYQIQTKFRDEIRPYGGIIRSREFLMKDAYSFHYDKKSLKKTYKQIYETYITIFKKIGLNFIIVKAYNGSIGGNISHEFQVFSKYGKDKIAISNKSKYAANIEVAKYKFSKHKFDKYENLRLINTSNINNINELINSFSIKHKRITKTFIVKANKKFNKSHYIALILRIDHNLNIFKIEKLPQIYTPLTLASDKEIYDLFKTNIFYLGPVNMKLPVIVDYSAYMMDNFISGSNIHNKHFFDINWKRDVNINLIEDLRNVIDGDISPDGKGQLKIKNCIEIGHIFQLGTKYSKIMKLKIKGKDGKNNKIYMGCYGIGITRLISSIIEQNNIKNKIIWPESIAPFNIAILPINMHKSLIVNKISNYLYNEIKKIGIDTILYDKKVSPGVMFAEIELIGIPNYIIVSERNLKNKKIEYKNLITGKVDLININNIVEYLNIKFFKK